MRIFWIIFVLFLGLMPAYFGFETPVLLTKEANLTLNLGSEYLVKDLGTKLGEGSFMRQFLINSTKDPKKNASLGIMSQYALMEIDPTEFWSLWKI